MGLPTFLIAIAENQVPAARAMHRLGAAIFLGTAMDNLWKKKLRSIMHSIADVHELKQISHNSAELCDGRGVDRVSDHIEDLVNIKKNDC